jgi:hypothetical protein
MFEYPDPDLAPLSGADEVVAHEGIPVEFFYKGRAFHIHALLSKWKETAEWWKHIGESDRLPVLGEKLYWKVEAAPIGTVNTFEIEFDLATNSWQIRPASRGR